MLLHLEDTVHLAPSPSRRPRSRAVAAAAATFLALVGSACSNQPAVPAGAPEIARPDVPASPPAAALPAAPRTASAAPDSPSPSPSAAVALHGVTPAQAAHARRSPLRRVKRPTPAGPAVFAVPASIPRDCSSPADAQLRAWLETVPTTAVVSFPQGGCYLVVDELQLRDRVRFVVEGNGSTFRLQGPGEAATTVWRILGGQDVTLRNLHIVGANPYRGDLADHCRVGKVVEWQHGVSFDGTVTGLLDRISVKHVCGDFVEAQFDGRKNTYAPARDITVRGSVFEGSGRMGFGLTDVDGFRLETSTITKVNNVAVDLELDDNIEYGRNIHIVGNRFGAIRFALFANAGSGFGPNVGDVVFSHNTHVGPVITCQPPFIEIVGPGPLRTGYTITDNTLMTASNAVDITRAKDVLVARNTVQFQPGGCDAANAGVRVVEVQGVRVFDNVFRGAQRAVSQVDSSGVEERNNQL